MTHGSSPTSVTPQRFSDLWKQESRTLWCVAAGVLGRPDGAEDVVQDAALIGLERLPELRSDDGFLPWMAQIVRFVALNARRRPRWTPLEDGTGISAPGPTPAPVAPDGRLEPLQHAFDDRLLAALQRLEETPRTCLLLKVVLDLDYGTICRLVGIPAGTAMSHVSRSRHRLRDFLTAETPVAPGERMVP